MKKFFIFFLFCIIIGLVAATVWYWQTNQFSKEDLKVEISGPATVAAGEEVNYIIRLKNNGKFRVETPELTFEFPKNSVPSDEKPARVVQSLEDIYPGEERTFEMKARLLGRRSEIMESKVSVVYRLKNLKNSYESKTGFSTQISSVPITFEFDLPPKIEGSESISFALNYFSNIDYPLENLRVRAEYPVGFKFVGSKPSTLDEKEWKVPTLTQADGGRIEITGTLDGDEGSQKIFKARLGFINQDGEFVLLQEAAQAVKIISATLSISQTINGSPSYIANVGDTLHYEIAFRNIGQKPIQNKFLMARLEGEFFDITSIKSANGDIAKGDNSIIWDGGSVATLKFLEAGEEGRVEFWVKVAEAAERQTKNPVLRNRLTIADMEKVFETKINSEIVLSQKVFYHEDVLGNSGPWPFEPGTTTTFTVMWQIKDTWNDLRNVKVKSHLPGNVVPTGKVSPSDAKLTFDSGSREVIWNVGDVPAFQGYSNEPLTLSFQIVVLPSPGDNLSDLPLIGEATMLSEDAASTDLLQTKANARNSSKLDDVGGGEPEG